MNYGMLLNHIFNGLTFNFFYYNKFNRDWSETLSHLLDMVDEGKATIDAHENLFDDKVYTLDISFDGVEYSVWVSNKQFAYAHLYRINGEAVDKSSQFRPSIWVMMRLSDLFDKIENEMKEEKDNEIDDLVIDFKELNKNIKGAP